MNVFREQLVRNKYPATNLRHEVVNVLTASGQFDRNDPRSSASIVAPNKQIIATPLVIGKTPLATLNLKIGHIQVNQYVGCWRI